MTKILIAANGSSRFCFAGMCDKSEKDKVVASWIARGYRVMFG
jgi:hypothetical protein